MVVGAALTAFVLRHGSLDLPSHYLLAIVIAALLAANALHVARLYDQRNLGNIQMQLGGLTGAWFVVILILITLAFFSKTSDSFSRSWAVMWFAGSLIGFCMPLASAIANSVALLDCAVWGLIAVIVQIVIFFAVRLPVPKISERIEKGEMASGLWLGSASLAGGILNAASMTN